MSLMRTLIMVSLCWSLLACDTEQASPPLAFSGDNDAVEVRQLALPEREQKAYVTESVTVLGRRLDLIDEEGGCKLQVEGEKPVWLTASAPCYFVQSPGRDVTQVFQADKLTRVVAVVGTPVKRNRCGQEVNGIVVSSKSYHVSGYIMRGSIYCAENGLDNYQYALFARQ